MRVERIALALSLAAGCYSGRADFDGPGGADGGLDGVAADDDGDGDDDDDDDDDASWQVGPAPMRRLTRAQYLRSTRDLLEIPQWAPQSALPDEGANEEEFQLPNLLAATVTTTPVDYTRYRTVAREAAETAFATDDDVIARLGCQPVDPGEACVVDYLARTGERAFSRAVPDGDPVLTALVAIVADGTERLGSVRHGLTWAITSLLQSPEYLYFYPASDGDGGMDAYSKARSLALMFRDSIPDAELLAHARDGSLDDLEVLDAQIDRLIGGMIDDPSQRGAVQRFFDEWWSINLVESIGKDPAAFPEFSESLRTAMRIELERTVQDIVFERRADFRQVLVSDRIHVNDELAALYGLSGEFDGEFETVELGPDSPRSGLLSTAGFLSLMAHPTLTSPAARGRFVSERLLCMTIPPPPPGTDTVIPPPIGPETTRERFERHTTDPTCAGCHDLMDPPGLSMEEFDGLGRYRREEIMQFEGQTYELPIDTTGELNGVAFDNSKQMAAVLSEDPGFATCVTRQLLRQALGREITVSEYAAVQELEQHFRDSGMDFVSLMHQVARHRVFNTFTQEQ